MRRLALAVVFLAGVLSVTGCASSGDLERRVAQLREDIYRDIKDQSRSTKDEIRKQVGETEDRLGKEVKAVDDSQKKAQVSLGEEIVKIKETHDKDNIETGKTLIDHQKQIYSDRAMLEDTARRVYLLEKIVMSMTPAPKQSKSGYVTDANGDSVAISLGSVNGVNTGDMFTVSSGGEAIATVRVDTVEPNSARGKVISSTGGASVSVGDDVEAGGN